MKHTHGPWRTSEQYWIADVKDSKGFLIATIRERTEREETISNMHLISAAPDLLGACEDILSFEEDIKNAWCQCEGPNETFPEGHICRFCEWSNKVKQAIAKARGE